MSVRLLASTDYMEKPESHVNKLHETRELDETNHTCDTAWNDHRKTYQPCPNIFRSLHWKNEYWIVKNFPISVVRCPSLDVRRWMSVVGCPSLDIRPAISVLRYQSPNIYIYLEVFIYIYISLSKINTTRRKRSRSITWSLQRGVASIASNYFISSLGYLSVTTKSAPLGPGVWQHHRGELEAQKAVHEHLMIQVTLSE